MTHKTKQTPFVIIRGKINSKQKHPIDIHHFEPYSMSTIKKIQ